MSEADPQAQERLRQSLKLNPVQVLPLPDGSYHLKDGHHRTFLLNLLGDKTVPAVIQGSRPALPAHLPDHLPGEHDTRLPYQQDIPKPAIRQIVPPMLKERGVDENFADGRNPQDKGDSKRHGVPTKSSVSNLRKFAKSHSGRAAQLAHWAANMKAGRAKKKTNETVIGNLHFPRLIIAVDDHAIDRTRTRGINPQRIDVSLKKLSSIADQLEQMEVNNTVWVYDVANNIGMGLRRISSRDMRFKLKTVVADRPYDGVTPIIEID